MLRTHAAQSPYHGPTGPNSSSADAGEGTDILRVLWRWKWLSIFGIMIGIVAGYFYFLRQPPSFQSAALVQVVYPSAEAAGIETLDSPERGRAQSRLDESLIIKSVRVIDLAIEKSRLSKQSKLVEMSDAAIRDWILGRLVVQPAGRDSSTALIEIRFQCEDSELCQLVIEAVIAGYDHYLGMAYRDLGNEVVNVVTQSQDTLRKSYDELAKKNAEFRQRTPVVWQGNEGNNHYAEHCIQIKRSINEIDIEVHKLQSLLRHTNSVEAQGRPLDGILVALASDTGLRDSLLNVVSAVSMEEQKDGAVPAQLTTLPYSSAEQRGALVELQIKEQELLHSVGEGHPAVASIRRRIDMLKKHISYLSNSEKLQEAEFEANRKVVEPETPEKKLVSWKAAMQERLAAISLQREALQILADENERKSKELEEYLNQNTMLNSELAAVQTLLDGFTSTLNRLQLLPQGSHRTLQTLNPPAPGGFAGPKLSPYLLGGGAIGFMILGGLSVLLDWADKSFRSPDEISQWLGAPVVGHVPQIMPVRSRRIASKLEPTLCTANGSDPVGSEAFRSIRTSLYFGEASGSNRIIQVTSPLPGDGKSTVSSNLAISIAQSGRKVLLIDADMRRPRIGKMFALDNQVGLAEMLHHNLAFEEVVHASAIANLSLIAGVKPAHNPAELLSSSKFDDLLASLREEFDYIIIDTPPLLAVSDPCSVAPRADAVLLTVRLRRNARPLAKQAIQMLEVVGVRPSGIVVNGVTGARSYEYQYGHYNYEATTV